MKYAFPGPQRLRTLLLYLLRVFAVLLVFLGITDTGVRQTDDTWYGKRCRLTVLIWLSVCSLLVVILAVALCCVGRRQKDLVHRDDVAGLLRQTTSPISPRSLGRLCIGCAGFNVSPNTL